MPRLSAQEWEKARAEYEAPVYVPKILRNMQEICDTLGVGEKTVKAWIKQGAPIAVEGDGMKTRYSAETLRLQLWRERKAGKIQDSVKG